MRDITLLKSELVQCESELASITQAGISENVNSYTNYIDPYRANFLKGKIEYLLSQIEIHND